MSRLVAIFALYATLASAELLDRIALSIDNSVITEQQVLKQIRLAAFQNRQPVNITPATKRQAAEQLLERTLVEREMKQNAYPEPDPASVDEAITKFRQARFGSEQQFRQELAKYGLTEDEVRQFLTAQAVVLQFIDLRFRPAIQVTDAELQDYYQNEFVPNWQKRNTQPPPALDQVKSQIEQIMLNEMESQALDRWLGETRRNADIRWQQEVFR